jgi:hypothetical protein
VPAQEAEGNIKDKVKGYAYALEVSSLVCALKDKQVKQTSV